MAVSATGEIGVVGINGAQGSGKSTLSTWLVEELAETHGLSAVILSLDDFYLTKTERAILGRTIHPLCETRGVPGTHEVDLCLETMLALQTAGALSTTPLPRFDKLLDDRLPRSAWPEFVGRPDLILFEGWCVRATAQPSSALQEPINALERDFDPQGVWRNWANDCLATTYQDLWKPITKLVMIEVPGLDFVMSSRLQQEQQLAQTNPAAAPMNQDDIAHFVAHYERLTRHMWATLPVQADILLSRNTDGFCNLRVQER